MGQRGEYVKGRQQEQVRVDIDRVVHETDSAILVAVEDAEHWIPFSQVHSIQRNGDQPHIMVTPWIAKQKGLV